MQRRPKRVGPYCRSQFSTLFLLLSVHTYENSLPRKGKYCTFESIENPCFINLVKKFAWAWYNFSKEV